MRPEHETLLNDALTLVREALGEGNALAVAEMVADDADAWSLFDCDETAAGLAETLLGCLVSHVEDTALDNDDLPPPVRGLVMDAASAWLRAASARLKEVSGGA